MHAEKSQRSEFDDNMLTRPIYVGALRHVHRYLSKCMQEDEAEKCCSECCMPDLKHPNQPASSEVLARIKRVCVGISRYQQSHLVSTSWFAK